MSPSDKRIRVLVGKPGLDGHDVGAKILVRALMDAGMEVIYTGLRKSPEEIAQVALDEDVDLIGLSILSGSHIPLTRALMQELALRHAEGIPVILGGQIPKKDAPALEDLGVAGIFPTGTPFDTVIAFIHDQVADRRAGAQQ
jgi:methylmalonyl-CoA mutase cobalamin-binding domain/chain